MNDILLTPAVAFVVYLLLVGLLAGMGRVLAGRPNPDPFESALKNSAYGSGEASPTTPAAPGYGKFFRVALFFAVLHLGVLMLGSSISGSPLAVIYLGGLVLVLLALILG